MPAAAFCASHKVDCASIASARMEIKVRTIDGGRAAAAVLTQAWLEDPLSDVRCAAVAVLDDVDSHTHIFTHSHSHQAQMLADRQNQQHREVRASHAQLPQGGGTRLNRFSDIGVDLNKGG